MSVVRVGAGAARGRSVSGKGERDDRGPDAASTSAGLPSVDPVTVSATRGSRAASLAQAMTAAEPPGSAADPGAKSNNPAAMTGIGGGGGACSAASPPKLRRSASVTARGFSLACNRTKKPTRSSSLRVNSE